MALSALIHALHRGGMLHAMDAIAPAEIGPRPYDPSQETPAPSAPPTPRRSLGEGYDWVMELLRQLYRPALGVVCLAALADNYLFASWWRGGAGRLDEMSLLILVGLAAGLAGLRAAELTIMRPR